MLRAGLAAATLARWELQQDARVQHITPACGIPIEYFHMESKRYAEVHATTYIYVVADDDCLILGKDFIEKGVAALEKHPYYGMIGATSISDGYYPVGFQGPNEVEGATAAGGVVFVRKGILTTFDDCLPDQVDDVIAQEFTRKGWSIGVMPYVKFNHLGAWYSVTSRNPDNWKA